MLFRALTIVCAVPLIILSGCATGETLGSVNCCYPTAITDDGNPVPGNGNWREHACNAGWPHAHRCYETVEYWAFNTNADYPPYETFWCDQWPRANYTIAKKFDNMILDYDWDETNNVRCEPNCCQPPCRMKYVAPCDRPQPNPCCEPVPYRCGSP